MATISIDYDSNGDVELILQQTENNCFNQAAKQAPQANGHEKPVEYKIGPIGVKVKEFRLRVSSMKLISSSRYFQAMLEGPGFREGKELKEHGFITIELLDPEDEPTAMMIVLGILYGNDFQVPIDLDLPTFYKVAVLVDKYQWHGLVTPHATSWFDRHVNSQGLQDVFDNSLLTWLWISWLFGMKDHFKTLSRVAQQNASKPIDLADESIRLSTIVLRKWHSLMSNGIFIGKVADVALQLMQKVPTRSASLVILYSAPRLSEIRDHQFIELVMSLYLSWFAGVR
jgi:hypothetical protein